MHSEWMLNHLPDIALAAAIAWGAGLRLYLVTFLLGLLGTTDWLELPPHLLLLTSPVAIGISGLMMVVEFGADKLPWLDSLWDALHTFIRIPAGAALATAVFGLDDAQVATAAAVLGGGITASAHFGKAAGRALLNASPEPFSNWAASFSEDLMVPGALWLALTHPVLLLALVLVFLTAVALFARLIWSGVAAIFARWRPRA